MSILVNQIAVDRCYETATGQVRRVRNIENGMVEYEEQLPTGGGGTSGQTITEGLAHFAGRVKLEVPCIRRNRSAGWT
jgi:hypothetical protein